MAYTTYFVEIPNDYDNSDLEEYLIYIKENYIDIYQKLKFGDFIENGNESGYRSEGLYIIDKNEKDQLVLSHLSNEPDDYGTIPLNFEGFTKFDAGYHFETIRDKRCISSMHNNFFPINLLYLLNQEWKKNYLYNNYCEFYYNNIFYIAISNLNIADLLSIEQNTIYGKIYTTKETKDYYYQYYLNLESEEGKFLSKYEKILFI